MDYGPRMGSREQKLREMKRKTPKMENNENEDNADQIFEELSDELDHALVGEALIISDLFRSAAKAAAILPDMELKTKLFSVTVDGKSILMRITRPKKEDEFKMDYPNEFHSNQARDPGYDDEDWYMEEEEEERIYEEC